MRTHRVARSKGLAAYLDVSGYGHLINARLRVVREAGDASIYTPPFAPYDRHFVVQWAFELGRIHVLEFGSAGSAERGDA